MKARRITIIFLTFLIALSLSKTGLPVAHAIGVADVIEQTVYWGTDITNPQTAHPGDTNIVLSIVLTNIGDDIARNVTATLYFNPPVDYTYVSNGVAVNASSWTKLAGDMDAGSTFTLTYTVSVEPSAIAGVYHYDLQIAFKSARELQQITKTVLVDVPITQGELHIESTVTDPFKTFPDSYDNTVTVTIANSGNGLAKDVQVYLELTPPFLVSSSGSNQIFLGNLPAGQTTPANFHVDVMPNATFGQYELTLAQVIDNRLIPIGQVPLYVAEKARFTILSINPDTLHPGDSGVVVTVQVQNTASVLAESVRVELQVGNDITGTLTDFLSDIPPGQNKTAIFTLTIDNSMPVGSYPVGLRFDWSQDDNQYALDHTYLITLYIEPGGVATYAPIAVVAILIIGGGYFARKKILAKKAAAKPAPVAKPTPPTPPK
ncbi:MAG: COG1361 S-layer family protein [Candidatus Bathyarchaeia archaeon]